MSKPLDWSIAIAGECMVNRPFSMHSEAEFVGVRELFAGSDVTYAHLEMSSEAGRVQRYLVALTK